MQLQGLNVSELSDCFVLTDYCLFSNSIVCFTESDGSERVSGGDFRVSSLAFSKGVKLPFPPMSTGVQMSIFEKRKEGSTFP